MEVFGIRHDLSVPNLFHFKLEASTFTLFMEEGQVYSFWRNLRLSVCVIVIVRVSCVGLLLLVIQKERKS